MDLFQLKMTLKGLVKDPAVNLMTKMMVMVYLLVLLLE